MAHFPIWNTTKITLRKMCVWSVKVSNYKMRREMEGRCLVDGVCVKGAVLVSKASGVRRAVCGMPCAVCVVQCAV